MELPVNLICIDVRCITTFFVTYKYMVKSKSSKLFTKIHAFFIKNKKKVKKM